MRPYDRDTTTLNFLYERLDVATKRSAETETGDEGIVPPDPPDKDIDKHTLP